MESSIRVKSGHLSSQHKGKLGGKSWSKRWCILMSGSKGPSGSTGPYLQQLESKDSDKHPKIVELDGLTKVEKQSKNEFTVVLQQETYRFRCDDSVELDSWTKAFNSVVPNDRQSVGSLHSGEEVIVDDNDLYMSLDAPSMFAVTVLENEDSKRCNLSPKDRFYLAVNPKNIALLSSHSESILYQWPYTYIRRFGRNKGLLQIYAGRRSNTGAGLFQFTTEEAEAIYDKVLQVQKQAAPSGKSPLTPAREFPAAPSRATPAAPSREFPAAPSRATPAAPSREVPAAPSRATPAAPSRANPAAPSRATPAAPSRATPAAPSKEAPIAHQSESLNTLHNNKPKLSLIKASSSEKESPPTSARPISQSLSFQLSTDDEFKRKLDKDLQTNKVFKGSTENQVQMESDKERKSRERTKKDEAKQREKEAKEAKQREKEAKEDREREKRELKKKEKEKKGKEKLKQKKSTNSDPPVSAASPGFYYDEIKEIPGLFSGSQKVVASNPGTPHYASANNDGHYASANNNGHYMEPHENRRSKGPKSQPVLYATPDEPRTAAWRNEPEHFENYENIKKAANESDDVYDLPEGDTPDRDTPQENDDFDHLIFTWKQNKTERVNAPGSLKPNENPEDFSDDYEEVNLPETVKVIIINLSKFEKQKSLLEMFQVSE